MVVRRQADSDVRARARRVLRIAVLLATLGAGGTLSVRAAAGPPDPSEWRVLTLSPPASGPSSFAEPDIIIRPDGAAIADAATANTGAPPTYWLSRDGGYTWSTGSDFDLTGSATGDADGTIGSDGYLYALNLAYNPSPPSQPTNPTVLVFRSADGSTWQGPATFPAPHGADQPDRPWIVVDPMHPSDVDVVNSEVGGNIVMWQSQDHAASFAGPVPVTGGANGEYALALSSRPLFDPTDDQRMYMLYETVTPAGLASMLAAGPPVYEFPMTQIWLAVSTDAGSTWSNQLALDTSTLTGSPLEAATIGHLLIASAIDPQGDLYAAFSLRPAGATQTSIYLIHSRDHGNTWSSPAEVPAPMASNVMPSLAVAGGSAFLSWYGSSDADFRDSAATWYEMFAASSDPLNASPSFSVGQVSSAPVHVGGIDTAGTIGSDAGANWGLRDFQAIAVDGCGYPHPIWAVDDGENVAETAVPASESSCGASAQVPELIWAPLALVAGAILASIGAKRRRVRHAAAL